MPPEVVQRIYDLFFTTKAAGEGTGIGLSCGPWYRSQSRWNDHGGEPQVGQGTTFTIYLPCIASDMAVEGQADETVPHGQGRLLFVDLMSLRWSVFGYSVLTCSSAMMSFRLYEARGGTGGLPGCAPQRFDLVITDYTMPQMTGDVLTCPAPAAS